MAKTMTEECAQAISFANGYFALVDGLASGLENHLAEDVVLQWFGVKVCGRKKVVEFLRRYKIKSRHVFPNILPVSVTDCNNNNYDWDKSISMKNSLTVITEESTVRKYEGGDTQVVESIKNEERDDVEYKLSEGDLENLFKSEIAVSDDVERIERSINRIKLEEEMAPTMKAIKREAGQGDGPVTVETSTTKYVEASGKIEFSRKLCNPGKHFTRCGVKVSNTKRNPRTANCRNLFLPSHDWQMHSCGRPCIHAWQRFTKLRIAYTPSSASHFTEVKSKKRKFPSKTSQYKSKLPSLEELGEISNRLVPHTENFFFLKESDNFFENLEKKIAELHDPQALLLSPQYMRDNLILKKPSVKSSNFYNEDCKTFIFNYQIHLIIYESLDNCRMNLLQQFENTKESE